MMMLIMLMKKMMEMIMLLMKKMMMMLVMVVGADSRAGPMAKAKALSLLNGRNPPLTFPQMHSTLYTPVFNYYMG